MVKSQSPLLNHLITAEKNAQAAFTSYTTACEAANNALNGWAAADTGVEDQDLYYMETTVLTRSLACFMLRTRPMS